MDYLSTIVPAIADGLQVTLKIFVITIVLSLPLGIIMA
ncbi:MAG: amino acid ABC transporter permease, partial [Megasphaera micronuciformis]|nr:amino acid ABC transporter permease [Megasphaera micronuciformis]